MKRVNNGGTSSGASPEAPAPVRGPVPPSLLPAGRDLRAKQTSSSHSLGEEDLSKQAEMELLTYLSVNQHNLISRKGEEEKKNKTKYGFGIKFRLGLIRFGRKEAGEQRAWRRSRFHQPRSSGEKGNVNRSKPGSRTGPLLLLCNSVRWPPAWPPPHNNPLGSRPSLGHFQGN